MTPTPDNKEAPSAPDSAGGGPNRQRIALLQESLQVGKRIVDTGRGVRVHKQVHEHVEQVELALRYDEITVERVPRGILLADGAPPAARYEGATLIVPVLEEVLKVTRQWRLVEEVRVTRHQRERQSVFHVPLKTETVSIERYDESPAGGGPSSPEGE